MALGLHAYARRRVWLLDAAAVVVATVTVGLPAIATRDGFAYDFTNHLWLVWVQQHSISAHWLPTYFLNAPTAGGVFNPFFEFYGGTLYAVSGALAAVLGHRPIVAYVAVILLCIAAAYAGMVWLARQCGALTWRAHAPAVAFVGSAYYVTNLYGRGAWPEFVAASAMPMLVAAGLQIARSRRLEPLPAALFAVAAVVWSGSHNITLAWGTVALAATFGCLRLVLRRPLVAGRRQLGWLLGLLALAGCVNGWFLLPDILYSNRAQIVEISKFSWNASRDFNTPRALFDPLRYVPSSSSTAALYVQAPVWMLVWALAAAAALRSQLTRTMRRAGIAVAIVLVGLLALIMVRMLWWIVPAPLQLIQIPYRLNTYVALLIAALVLVGVLAVESSGATGRRRALSAALASAMAITIGLSVWQLWVPATHTKTIMPLSYEDRRDVFVSIDVAPRTWYDSGAYLDAGEPVVRVAAGRVVQLDPTGIDGNRASLTITPPPGPAPFAITSGAGPKIAHLGGLIRVGRTRNGLTVARRPNGSSGPVRITLATAGGATTVGAVLSVLGLLGLAAVIGAAAVVSLRRRRGASAAP